jgi:hypothetical protein
MQAQEESGLKISNEARLLHTIANRHGASPSQLKPLASYLRERWLTIHQMRNRREGVSLRITNRLDYHARGNSNTPRKGRTLDSDRDAPLKARYHHRYKLHGLSVGKQPTTIAKRPPFISGER